MLLNTLCSLITIILTTLYRNYLWRNLKGSEIILMSIKQIFSKWRHIVDCDMFDWFGNSQVLCRGLYTTNNFIPSKLHRQGLSSNDLPPEKNLPNQLRLLVNSLLHYKCCIFCLRGVFPLLKLPQHHVSNMHIRSLYVKADKFII